MSPSSALSSTTSPVSSDVTVGERIVWFDLTGSPQLGTVKWVGHLAGHVSLYAGVDFVSDFLKRCLLRITLLF